MRIGKQRAVPPRAPRRRAVHHRQSRRPTSPARCTSATRSTTRCRTSSSATRGCRARMRCGWSAPIMPASPRRWWSSGRWTRARASAPITPASSSSRRSGSGRPRAAARSPRQLRRLGCVDATGPTSSFTMDPRFSKAVIHVFVELYEEGLLYRDKRLVNWDPGLKTAISDLEVETREVQGRVLASALSAGGRRRGHDHRSPPRGPRRCSPTWRSRCIRPTSAIRTLIGKQVRLPITGRLIPIVADEHADPELGSGAVKITPGHDFNDFEVGRRAGIAAARHAQHARCRGEGRADGRRADPGRVCSGSTASRRAQAIVARLKADGRAGAACRQGGRRARRRAAHDRDALMATAGGAVIEPWLTDQWYVDAKTLAGPPIDGGARRADQDRAQDVGEDLVQLAGEHPAVVRVAAAVVGAPDSGLVWLRNGQRSSSPRRAEAVRAPRSMRQRRRWFRDSLMARDELRYRKTSPDRDPDVLDTWFSSALWPFATLGWPERRRPSSRSREGQREVTEWRQDAAPAATHFDSAQRERGGWAQPRSSSATTPTTC